MNKYNFNNLTKKKLANEGNTLYSLSSKDDDDLDSLFSSKNIMMYQKTKQLTSVDVYLDEPIGNLTYYRGLIQYLHDMDEGDEIRIWVDTPGGDLDTTLAIVDAMQNACGNVLTIVTGNASSAGSLIALLSPNLVLGDRARFFLHSASYGSIGKQGEVEAHVENSKEFLREIMREAYTGFLTEDEMQLLFIGKDYYFRGDCLRERVANRCEYLESLAPKEDSEDKYEGCDDQECIVCKEASDDTSIKVEKPKRVRKKS